MQPQDKANFATALAGVAETFGVPMTDAQVEGYWSGLKDLSIKAVGSALAASIRQCERFPKPVEIRRLAGIESTDAVAMKAWSEVVKAAQRGGGQLSDATAAESVRLMGGFKRLGQMNEEDLQVWGRKQFVECYEAVAEKTSTNDRLLADGAKKGLGEHVDLSGIIGSLSGRRVLPGGTR
jgi:hypothetical protein